MLKIRRPLGRLIFNMGIAIPGKTVFLIETAPRSISLHALHTSDFQVIKHHIFTTKDSSGLSVIFSVTLWVPQSCHTSKSNVYMMTSSNGNIFRVTGPLCVSGIHRWIPLTKASDAGLRCFLWSVPEQTVEQTIESLVIWDAITLIIPSLYTTRGQSVVMWGVDQN